jgi:hypothetical protein
MNISNEEEGETYTDANYTTDIAVTLLLLR